MSAGVRPTAFVMRGLMRSAAVCLAIASPAWGQSDTPDQAAIRSALTRWMADFNAGRADKVCDLFAP